MIDPQLPAQPSAAPPQRDDTVPAPSPPIGLAVAVIVMSWVWVAWLIVLGCAGLASQEVWRDAVERQLAYEETAFVPFDFVYLPVRGYLAAAFVVVSLWLHRSLRFAEAHHPGYRFRLSVAWTWFGWLIPVLSLWFPALVTADIWRATLRRPTPWFFGVWWGCWLALLWLSWTVEGWLGGVLGWDALGEEAMLAGGAYLICAVLAAFSCSAWTVIVVRVRRGQVALAAQSALPPSSMG